MRKYILNIKWPKTITNEKIYEKTEIEKWSQIARKRRLKFFGKVVRMDEDIPVKKVLKYATEPLKKSIGKPKTTWLSTIKSDLERNNMSWENAIEIAKNKKVWNNITKNFA